MTYKYLYHGYIRVNKKRMANRVVLFNTASWLLGFESHDWNMGEGRVRILHLGPLSFRWIHVDSA